MKLKLTKVLFLRIKIAIWLSYLIYLNFAIFLLEKIEILFGVFLAGAIIQLTIIPFITNWFKHGKPLLLDWFRLSTFITLILNFFVLAYSLDSQSTILIANRAHVSSTNSVQVLIAVFIGLVALKISEIIIRPNRGKFIQSSLKDIRIRSPLIFYSFVILVGVIQLIFVINDKTGYGSDPQNFFSEFSFLFQLFNVLAPLFLSVLAVLFFLYNRKSNFEKLIFVIFFVIQILYGFLSGMKENIIVPVLILLVPYLMSGKMISRKLIIVGVVSIVILYPINNRYRNLLNNSALSKSNALQSSIYLTINNEFGNILSSGSESYLARLSLFPMAMYGISIERNWSEYKNLNRYTYLPVAWIIPRFLLPNKPGANIGGKLNELLSGNDSTSITPSTYVWSFLEGGFLFIFITFLLFGLLISIIEKRIEPLNRLFYIVIYSLIFVSLLKIESDIFFRISGIFHTFFICFIVSILFFKSRKSHDYTNL